MSISRQMMSCKPPTPTKDRIAREGGRDRTIRDGAVVQKRVREEGKNKKKKKKKKGLKFAKTAAKWESNQN